MAAFFFGQRSVEAEVARRSRLQAQASIRRIVNLGVGINTFRDVLEVHADGCREVAGQADGQVPLDSVETMVSTLTALVDREIKTAEDAVQDWFDMVPEAIPSARSEVEV